MTAALPLLQRWNRPRPFPEPTAKTNTLETRRLATALDAYEREPTADHTAQVKQAMAALDSEIAELEARAAKTTGGDREEAAVKLKNLQTYRDTQTARFTVMRATSGRATGPPAVDDRSATDKAGDKAREIGGKIEDAGRHTGAALEDAGKRAKESFQDATR